MKIVHKVH